MGGITALTLGAIGAGYGALSGFTGGMAQGSQQRAKAAAMSAQAENQRARANAAREQGRIDAETIDRQKRGLTRKFNEIQGAGRVGLGAGNVDMSSGSAAGVSEGNILNYAANMGENAHDRMVKEWETAQNVKSMNWVADAMDSQASYLKRTANNFGTSLLTTAINGVSTGLGAYGRAGGRLGDLFGIGKTAMSPKLERGINHLWGATKGWIS